MHSWLHLILQLFIFFNRNYYLLFTWCLWCLKLPTKWFLSTLYCVVNTQRLLVPNNVWPQSVALVSATVGLPKSQSKQLRFNPKVFGCWVRMTSALAIVWHSRSAPLLWLFLSTDLNFCSVFAIIKCETTRVTSSSLVDQWIEPYEISLIFFFKMVFFCCYLFKLHIFTFYNVFLVFPMGFRPPVVLARLDALPIDIMLTFLPSQGATSTCLHWLEFVGLFAKKSTGGPMHRGPPRNVRSR